MSITLFDAGTRTATTVFTTSTSSTTLTWVTQIASFTAIPNYGYFIQQGTLPITVTLPNTGQQGQAIALQGIISSTTPTVTGYNVTVANPASILIMGVTGQQFYTVVEYGAIYFVYSSQTSSWVATSVSSIFTQGLLP